MKVGSDRLAAILQGFLDELRNVWTCQILNTTVHISLRGGVWICQAVKDAVYIISLGKFACQ